MICCWCGRAIWNMERCIYGFWPGALVHFWCFYDYVGDRQVDREELLQRLELGGEG